jgi:hypothetical protein
MRKTPFAMVSKTALFPSGSSPRLRSTTSPSVSWRGDHWLQPVEESLPWLVAFPSRLEKDRFGLDRNPRVGSPLLQVGERSHKGRSAGRGSRVEGRGLRLIGHRELLLERLRGGSCGRCHKRAASQPRSTKYRRSRLVDFGSASRAPARGLTGTAPRSGRRSGRLRSSGRARRGAPHPPSPSAGPGPPGPPSSYWAACRSAPATGSERVDGAPHRHKGVLQHFPYGLWLRCGGGPGMAFSVSRDPWGETVPRPPCRWAARIRFAEPRCHLLPERKNYDFRHRLFTIGKLMEKSPMGKPDGGERRGRLRVC